MALSTAVFVGDAAQWIPDLVERSKKLKVNAGIDPEKNRQCKEMIDWLSGSVLQLASLINFHVGYRSPSGH